VQNYSLPTLAHALARLAARPIEVRGIISLGAGGGGDSVAMLKQWPDAKLLLVEMDDRFEDELTSLKARHPGVSYEVCGAAGEDREGLQLKSDRFGGAIVKEGSASDHITKTVRLRRVDTLVREHDINGPYFLKFDTHGAELDILAGASEVLANTALIMMEVYNFKLRFMDFKNLTFDEMSLHMKQLGFRCVDVCDPLFRPGDMALWQMHMFFIRADHAIFNHTSYSIPKAVTP
jgi:FkbM family methyltransferase